MSNNSLERWEGGSSYENYVGRWSRLVAAEFLDWLRMPSGSRWLDVGCGTGALSATILRIAEPSEVKGIDRSEAYVEYARSQIPDARADFVTGDAQALPLENDQYHAVVSGLVLNFVPDMHQAVTEMARVARPGGTVGVYVWDYADSMQLMRYFWDAAAALNPEVATLEEGLRFPICKPDALEALFRQAGLHQVETRAIDVRTRFENFDDYWSPFTDGPGPAPRYAMSLNEADRNTLRDALQARLPIQPDGSIDLIARAWAVKGIAD